MITQKKIDELKHTGNWMVRFSNDGVGYNNFKWALINEWTEAPDWNTHSICSGGLFGQSVNGWGYCKTGSRFEFCEIEEKIVVQNEKVKCRRAKIIAVNAEAFEILSWFNFGGYLDLRGYTHPLPVSLASVGGSIDR